MNVSMIGAAKASPKALACYDGTLHPCATGSQYGVGRGSRRMNTTATEGDIFINFFYFLIVIIDYK